MLPCLALPTNRKRQYNAIWARVSRAQKRQGEDLESHTPKKSVREISGGTNTVAEINLGELNTLCEDRPHIVTEIETDDNEEAVGPTLRDEMSEWASNFSVTHNALDALLKVLQRQGHKDLPSTARILYDATRKFKVKTVGGVETIAYNVADQVSLHLNKCPPDSTQNIQLIFPSILMAYLFSSLQTNHSGQFYVLLI